MSNETQLDKDKNKILLRESNYELLRILAMFAILTDHFFSQTNAKISFSGLEQFIIFFFGDGSRIAVGIFLMLGAWFMVDIKFKAKRVLKFYSELLFYTLSILFFLRITHTSTSMFDTIRCIFPFYGRALWFLTSYISLMLLAPFLNVILRQNKDYLKKLLIVLALFTTVFSTLWFHRQYDTPYCELLWFLVTYIFIYYFKKYIYKNIKISKGKILFIGLSIYSILVTLNWASLNFGFLQNIYGTIINKISTGYIIDYKTIPAFLCSLCIFIFFSKLSIRKNNFINSIAKNTLAVYIITTTPGFYMHLWKDLFKIDKYLNDQYFLIYSVIVLLVVYISCIIIDKIRQKYVEPLIVESKIFKFLEERIDEFYSTITKDKELNTMHNNYK